MLTVFKIRDTYKIIENATGLSSDEQHDFVQRYNGGDHVFSTREEAEERMSTLPVDTDGGKYRRVHNYDVWVVKYGYCNMHGWSDVHPFEIVRVVSPKCIELRAMKAKLDEDFKPDYVPGGFAGHIRNQHKQTYKYESCDEGVVIRARLGKKGWKSSHGRHVLNDEPRKFYDYNFQVIDWGWGLASPSLFRKEFIMIYRLRLVNFPHSSAEDKVFRDLSEAKDAAEATGFDTCVEGFSSCGMLLYMLGYSTISGWSK